MIAGPGDDRTAGHARSRGRLRASHADREQVVEVLKTAFAQGRLDKDELDGRLSQALVSRTYAELAALTADIPVRPAGPAVGQPPREPARAQGRPMSNAAKAGISVAVAVAVAAVMAVLTGGFALVLFVPFYFMALLVAAGQMLYLRHEKRSRGQLPPQPGQAPELRQPGQAGQELAPPGGRPDRDRADLRRHSSRPDRPGGRAFAITPAVCS